MSEPAESGACAEKRGSIGARRNPETEAAVLDAAQEILAEKGIGGLSMEAVARRARAGKATLYRWWPTRGALLMAVYRRQKQVMAFADTGALESDVAGVFEQLFAHWSRPEGQMFRHIIAAAQGDPDLAEALETYRQERLVSLEALFARAAARGELGEEVRAADMAVALMGLAWLKLLTGDLSSDPALLAASLVRRWSA